MMCRNFLLACLILSSTFSKASDIPVFDAQSNQSFFGLKTLGLCEANPYAAWIACEVPEGIQFINLRDQAQNFLFDHVSYVVVIGWRSINSRLKTNSSSLIFSPDGQKAIYVQEVDLWLIDFVTKEVRNITPKDLPTYSEILVSNAGSSHLFNVTINRIRVGENGGFHTHDLVKHYFFDFKNLEFISANNFPMNDNYTANFVDSLSGNVFNISSRYTLLVIRPDNFHIQKDLEDLIRGPNNYQLADTNFIGFNKIASEGFTFSCLYEKSDSERRCDKLFKLTRFNAITGEITKTLDLHFQVPLKSTLSTVFFSEERNQMIGFFGDEIKVINTDLEIVENYQFKNVEQSKVIAEKYFLASQVDENKKEFIRLIDVEHRECRKFEVATSSEHNLSDRLFNFVEGLGMPKLQYYPSHNQGALLVALQGETYRPEQLPTNVFEQGKTETRIFDLSSLATQPLENCLE